MFLNATDDGECFRNRRICFSPQTIIYDRTKSLFPGDPRFRHRTLGKEMRAALGKGMRSTVGKGMTATFGKGMRATLGKGMRATLGKMESDRR